MKNTNFPTGWDEDRVRRVLEHYETQSEDEAVAEDEAALDDESQVTMIVPKDLVPEIEALIARRRET
ncbi:MAG: hypothetical protein ACYDCC_13340 [Actinomycetota bacterium]